MKRSHFVGNKKLLAAAALGGLLAASLTACSSLHGTFSDSFCSLGVCGLTSSAKWCVLSALDETPDSPFDEALLASQQTAQELARLRTEFADNFAAVHDANGVRLPDRFEIGERLPYYQYENETFNQHTGLYPLYNNGTPVALVSVQPQDYKPDPELDGVSDRAATITYYGHDANFKTALKSSSCLVLVLPAGTLDESSETNEYIVDESLHSFEITSWARSSEHTERNSSELPDSLKDEVSQLQMAGTALRIPVIL